MTRFPAGAVNFPVLIIVPPSKVKFLPGSRVKSAALMMLPGCDMSKAKVLGLPIKF